MSAVQAHTGTDFLFRIENYEECFHLKIAESQKAFVSSTVHSLVQAWVYYDTTFSVAIYADNTMVGFIMPGYYEVEGYYTLWKLMIEQRKVY